MQKVFLFLLLFLLPLAEVPIHAPASEPVSVASTPETDEIDQLFDDMQLDGIVSYTAFRQAGSDRLSENRAEKQVHHDPDRFFKTIYREAPLRARYEKQKVAIYFRRITRQK